MKNFESREDLDPVFRGSEDYSSEDQNLTINEENESEDPDVYLPRKSTKRWYRTKGNLKLWLVTTPLFSDDEKELKRQQAFMARRYRELRQKRGKNLQQKYDNFSKAHEKLKKQVADLKRERTVLRTQIQNVQTTARARRKYNLIDFGLIV